MTGIPPVFTPVVPSWLLVVLFLVGTSTALLAYRAARPALGEARARAVSLLRLAAAWLLCVFALNPVLSVRKMLVTHPAIAVVLDASASMGQPVSRGKESRLETARSILAGGARPLLNALGDKYAIDVYALADSLRPLTATDRALLKADGNDGDLRETLETLGRTHSVVLLLSDGDVRWGGGDGGGLSGRRLPNGPSPGAVSPGSPPPEDSTSVGLPPVLAVPVGGLEGYRDILIAGIDAPPLAFRGREAKIDVTVKAYGYAGTSLPVLLRDSERLAAAGRVPVNSDLWEQTVTLSFLPVEAGRKDLAISVPLQPGEAVTANNSVAVALKVVRDETRVLMVSGSPSLGYRFLRAALKNDPSVDLLSFVILRDPSDILDVPTREQSLIPFPVDTLFSKELSGFDLLIFDNFDYSLFLNEGHLQSVRNFVEAGGGFGVFGGPNLFPETLRGENPVADILPVENPGPGSYVRNGPVGVRMSSEGAGHPLMARFSADVLGGERETPRFWNEMPSLDGINETNAKDNAVVLLESAGGFPWPILTVSERGKGRVLVLGTDYTWKWCMGLVARGEGNQPYLELVHWIVRWLVRDPSLDPVQMRLPGRTVRAGEETAVRIAILGGKLPGNSRSDALPVSFAVSDPDRRAVVSRVERTPQAGEFVAYFIPEKGGVHRMEVAAPFAGAAESIVVAGPLDALDPAPDPGILGRIAEATGGELLFPGEDLRGKIEAHAAKAVRRYVAQGRRPLWANPFAVAAVLGLLGMEWYLRRRGGLM